jgi:hypothetical protein
MTRMRKKCFNKLVLEGQGLKSMLDATAIFKAMSSAINSVEYSNYRRFLSQPQGDLIIIFFKMRG